MLVGSVPSWGLLAYGLDSRQLVATVVAALVSIAINLSMIPRIGIYAPAIAAICSELAICALSAVFLIGFLRSSRRGYVNISQTIRRQDQ